MAELALIYPDGRISLSDLSRRHGISPLLLKKLARYLKTAGLLMSKEGVDGGYWLSRPPGEIKIWEIIGALKDPKYIQKQISPEICPLNRSCLPQTIRNRMLSVIKDGFSGLTLNDIIGGLNVRH